MADNPPHPPPPAPPLPPNSSNSQTRESPFILKVRNAPEGWFYQPPEPPALVDLFEPPTGPYFVYGTLMDPATLADVLGVEEKPALRPAKIVGYSRKLWGQYPAMQDGPQDAEVDGAVYHVQSVAHAKRLAEYETNSYKAKPCLIQYTDGKEPAEDFGHVFMFVDPTTIAVTREDSVISTAEKHEKLIQDILSSEFGLEVLSLRPMQRGVKQCECCKDTACRFYNTYVYRLEVKRLERPGAHQPSEPRHQDGVSPLPDDVSELAIRLTSMNTDLNKDIQVQCEAAAMVLFKEALRPLDPSLVPTLYGWVSNSKGQGWLLTNALPGEGLQGKFKELDPQSKRSIVAQIATILKHIQQYVLPSTAQGYGGLTFANDGSGSIVVGETPFPGGGPCSTHSAFYSECLKHQVARSKQCAVVKGWEGTDLPSRIAKLDDIFTGVQKWEKDLRPTLVHGDFDIHNLLFDPQTNRITGVVDFDLAHVGCQGEEYMWSLFSLGQLVLPCNKNCEDTTLHREFLLHGLEDAKDKFSSRPESFIDWETALMADEEFAKAGVIRPRDIPAMEEIVNRYWVIQPISPPIFFKARTLTYTPEVQQEMKKGEQRELEISLELMGC